MVQVVVSDYVSERRMVYALSEADFAVHDSQWERVDDLLVTFGAHPVFNGERRWCDLDVPHVHMMILITLKLMTGLSDNDRTDATSHIGQRMTFFLCSLIRLLQARAGFEIDLLSVYRVTPEDVTYNISARLDVEVPEPRSHLRLVIDDLSE